MWYLAASSTLMVVEASFTGKPTRRATEGGNSTLLFDQERALAFDYQSVCNNYDINLLVLSEEGEQLKPDEP